MWNQTKMWYYFGITKSGPMNVNIDHWFTWNESTSDWEIEIEIEFELKWRGFRMVFGNQNGVFVCLVIKKASSGNWIVRV